MKIHLAKLIIIGLLFYAMGNMIPIHIYAQEDADHCVKRTYTYRNAEFMNTNETYLSYPELFGLKEKEIQDKINAYIQKTAWDDMFGSLQSCYRNWYDTQGCFYGMHEQNELGEVRVNPGVDVIYYGERCYLYGNILSMTYSGNSYSDGILTSDGRWEDGKGSVFNIIFNIDLKTEKEVTLNEILRLGDEFFQTLKDADISQYNDSQWSMLVYEGFMNAMNETNREVFIKYGQTERYKWLLDEEGNLEIRDKIQDGWQSFKIPLSLFRDIIQPEYKEYINGLSGYDLSVPYDKNHFSSPSDKSTENVSVENVTFKRESYQYKEDVKLEYFQVNGLSDTILQGRVNDFIVDIVFDAVFDDISYAYMNNNYYVDDESDEKKSMIHVESILPDCYLSGSVLSFTHMQETTRKAYVTRDGIRKEEIHKKPWLQAFNYDIARGKELAFDDVFEADDEFFETIEKWGSDNRTVGEQDDITARYRNSIRYHFCFDMKYYMDRREQFINGGVKYYGWFIDRDEEGSNLCIYRYYALEDEDQCFKIPLSALKDKLKPEYKDCYVSRE